MQGMAVHIDGFHSIFSLDNWRALQHHAACWLVNIHITWHFCPPVSMVKDAMESVYILLADHMIPHYRIDTVVTWSHHCTSLPRYIVRVPKGVEHRTLFYVLSCYYYSMVSVFATLTQHLVELKSDDISISAKSSLVMLWAYWYVPWFGRGHVL